MATMQKTRPKQGQATETSLFTTDLATELQSAHFVKKLLAVSVSNLVYLRAIFPESSFAERELDGLHLKVLRDDAACPNARRLTQWVKSCFDAIDKKYLRQLTLLLYRDESKPDSVMETYTFRFVYNKDGDVTMEQGDGGANTSSVSAGPTVASEKTFHSTIRMFRTIMFLCQNLQSLPESCLISMKLLYYDDVTPVEYEPPGFRASDSHQVYFERRAVEVRVGDVDTRFHNVKLRVKTDDSRLVPEDPDDEEVHTTRVTQVGERPAETAVASLQSDPEPHVADSVHYKSPGKPASAVDTTGTPAPVGVDGGGDSVAVSPSQEVEPAAVQGEHVRCPCGVNEDDGLMVCCEICHCWQHGICFLILQDNEAPASHVCDRCAEPADRHCTDVQLPPLPSASRMATCLYRRGLCACEEFTRINVEGMARRMGVDAHVAEGLIMRLEKDGVLIRLPTKGGMRKVNKACLLQQAFPRYLNRAANGQRLSQNPAVNPKNPADNPQKPADIPLNPSENLQNPIDNHQKPAKNSKSQRSQSADHKRQSRNNNDSSDVDEGDISERTSKLELSDAPEDGDTVGDSLDTSLVVRRAIPRSRKRLNTRSTSAAEAGDAQSSQDFEQPRPRKKHKVSRIDGIQV